MNMATLDHFYVTTMIFRASRNAGKEIIHFSIILWSEWEKVRLRFLFSTKTVILPTIQMKYRTLLFYNKKVLLQI